MSGSRRHRRSCRRVHPGGRADAPVVWCGGTLTHGPRWRPVELEREVVAA
jgi:hypothetical protein